jgi:phage gp29-like protein
VPSEIERQGGQPPPGQLGTDAPQFQAVDPLKKPNAQGSAKIVYRDLPLVDTIHSWTVDGVRGALHSHVFGIFYLSGQLADSILGDDRVQATIGSRISGLFGREVIFEPADDSAAAKEVSDAWVKCWPKLATTAATNEMQAYTILEGFEAAQLVWDTSGPIWQPYMRPWHPRFIYYHWDLRRYIAISQHGQIVVEPGNGKWVLHAPYGAYRGWIRGAIRACAEPWLMRHWAMRDWARYSEKHGIPIVKALVPAAADQPQRDLFEAAISALGTESTIMLPQGVDKPYSYDIEYAEPTDDSWQSFPGLIDRCDMNIVLSIMFQNLTTEVKGGSFAATSAHMDIREGGIQFDNEAWAYTMREQVARPFAQFNFGDPELAPKTRWDVPKLSEHTAAADQFQKFGTAVEVMARGGIKFKDANKVRAFAAERFGLKDLPDFTIGDPVASSGGMGK